jgi:cell shape-determining protein MreC
MNKIFEKLKSVNKLKIILLAFILLAFFISLFSRFNCDEIEGIHTGWKILNNGNIYTIAYIEKDWDSLDFKTVESVEKANYNNYLNEYKENLKQYKSYLKKQLQENVDNGIISELEMYKQLSEI